MTTLKFDHIISNFVLEIAKIYTAFSDLGNTQEMLLKYEYDYNLIELIKTLEYGAKLKFKTNYSRIKNQAATNTKNSNVVVAFSGGKDSVATAIHLKNIGKNVFLYHLKGINKSYPDEVNHAIELSKILGCNLYVEEIKQSGTNDFKENPIKNQLIASMALDYAIRNNIGTSIAFGDFTNDTTSNSQFFESWSDTQEMWNAWTNYIKTYVPNIELIIPFSQYNETIDLISKNQNLLNKVNGCILPYRFRQTTRERNEKKYNVKLLPNRCGSCWKCCTEYIYLADKNLFCVNTNFYIHCLNFLLKKLPSVHPESTDISIKGAYSAFLHRDIKNSILFNDLIKNGKII